LGERDVRNVEVRGSIPLCSTNSKRELMNPSRFSEWEGAAQAPVAAMITSPRFASVLS
jgi:hypothetical protein